MPIHNWIATITSCVAAWYLTSTADNFADAFAKVVEYKPFARYREPTTGLVTVEWDKKDPEGEYQTLEQERKLELTRLLE